MRIPIRFGRLRPVFMALGLTPARSDVELAGDVVRGRMSWAFDASIPRSAIRAAAPRADRAWSIGVHGWRKTWIVNGAAGPLVELAIEPPALARTLGTRHRVGTLAVSVDDPDGLIAMLEAG